MKITLQWESVDENGTDTSTVVIEEPMDGVLAREELLATALAAYRFLVPEEEKKP